MSDVPPAEAPDDPGDAKVPDYAGELDHGSEPGSAERDGDAGSEPERVGVPGLVILGAIIVVVGIAATWAVLARGPGSRPQTTSTTSATVGESDAAALFAQNCAACHGPAGKGVPGGGAPVLAGSGLAAQAVAKFVVEGAPGMPAFGQRLSDVEIATVAAYVAALGRPG